MIKQGTQELLQFLRENPFLILRMVILIISSISFITSFSYLLEYTPEVYIRGVPFSVVLRALAFGGLLTVIERFMKIYEEIEEKRQKRLTPSQKADTEKS